MRLEQLNCLIAIDAYHSMNKASKHIFISQQSISAAILQLEEEFQTKLVLRTNKGSFLTEAGKALVEATQSFYKNCEDIKKACQSKAVSKAMTVLIEYAYVTLWDALYLYYAEHYPNTDLRRMIINYTELEHNMKLYSDAIAVIYMTDESLQEIQEKGYRYEIVKTQYLSLYVSPKSSLANNHVISLKSLHDMKILLYTTAEQPSALYFALQKYELESRNNKYIYSMTGSLQSKLAEYSDVICFAPDSTQRNSQIFPFVPVMLKEKIALNLCCISKDNAIPTELVEAFRKII